MVTTGHDITEDAAKMIRDDRGGHWGCLFLVVLVGLVCLRSDPWLAGLEAAERGKVAVVLNPDRSGKVSPNLYRDNIFQNCSRVLKESQPGIWKASHTDGNLHLECGETPE